MLAEQSCLEGCFEKALEGQSVASVSESSPGHGRLRARLAMLQPGRVETGAELGLHQWTRQRVSVADGKSITVRTQGRDSAVKVHRAFARAVSPSCAGPLQMEHSESALACVECCPGLREGGLR